MCGLEGHWRFLTQVQNRDIGLDMVTGLCFIHICQPLYQVQTFGLAKQSQFKIMAEQKSIMAYFDSLTVKKNTAMQ